MAVDIGRSFTPPSTRLIASRSGSATAVSCSISSALRPGSLGMDTHLPFGWLQAGCPSAERHRIARSAKPDRRTSRTLRGMRFDKTLDVQRAMAIYAHPDDAEFGMAGTVAKWAKAGVEMTYCMVTNGASGSQDPDMTRERLRDIRAAEQSEAAKILGVKNVVFLEFEDGYLEPTIEVRRAVARQIRIHKPDVIFTMDPTTRYSGEYVNHPD